jgi:peptidoglycan/xylan/chitin deacetylase (PgdA/CDA1 family)/SAM-dependent methyltransferase
LSTGCAAPEEGDVGGSVAVIAIARTGGVSLVRTLDALARQSLQPSEVIVIARAGDGRLSGGIRAVGEARDARVVDGSSLFVGAALNSAISGTASDRILCLQEGDEPADRFLGAAVATLGDTVIFAAADLIWASGLETIETATPTALDLRAALAAPHRAPSVGMFRREDWSAVGGYDPSLPALVEYDFLLRLLAGGRGAAVTSGATVRRILQKAGDDAEARSEALRVVLGRHLGVLQSDPAAFLVEREREATRLRDRHRALVRRRDATVKAIDTATSAALPLRAFLRGHGRSAVEFGELRATSPVSADWGYDRGTPIDRVFIERFIADHAADVRGTVLEVQENDLTRRFGARAVSRSDVLDVEASNPRAAVVADLRHAGALPGETYDCIVLTQTLHVIDDMPAVLRSCFRLLKPGGVLLATLPAASRVCIEYGRDGDFWRVTEAGARRVFEPVFGQSAVTTCAFGNVLTTTAFLQGLAAHELRPAEYDVADAAHPTLVGVRAVREAVPQPSRVGAAREDSAERTTPAVSKDSPESPAVPRGSRRGRVAILLYHRVGAFEPDPHGLAMPAEAFDQQMALVAARYLPIALGDALDAAAQRRLPHRAVAITFDDGYRDNQTCAVPILARYGIPAAFCLTTAHLSEPSEFWWDTLARVFAHDPAAHAAWYDRLVRASAEEIRQTVGRLREQAGTAPGGCDTMAARDLLDLAASASHTIAAHGVDHLYLPARSDEQRTRELVESRRTLEDLLGRDVRWFAYPFGAYDEAACQAAARAGYDGALTCDARPLEEAQDPFVAPRIEVRARTVGEFERMLEELL